jgi:hypothetical protein
MLYALQPYRSSMIPGCIADSVAGMARAAALTPLDEAPTLCVAVALLVSEDVGVCVCKGASITSSSVQREASAAQTRGTAAVRQTACTRSYPA